MGKAIQTRYIKTIHYRWKDLLMLQSKDFKQMSKPDFNAFRNSVIKYGLVRGVRGWEEKPGRIWCLDGNHLKGMLLKLEEEGFIIPDIIPVHLFDCRDRQEAAEFILLYSAVYAKVTYEGLEEHIQINHLDLGTVEDVAVLPGVSYGYWKQAFPPDSPPEEPGQTDVSKADGRYRLKPRAITFKLTETEYHVYLDALKKIRSRHQLDSLVDVLKYLVGKEIEVDDPDESAVI